MMWPQIKNVATHKIIGLVKMENYKCKATHNRAYWTDEGKSKIYFVYGEVYKLHKIKDYAVIYLDDRDLMLCYTDDSFKKFFVKV